jgi:hypothetical protein
MRARRWLAALLAAAWAVCMAEPPNALLLVAKPGLIDPNFSRTVVLVTQAEDASTVGVILNRPTTGRHQRTGEPIYSGGPVMPRTIVALFRSESAPPAPSFHVLQGVYLSMHPAIVERPRARSLCSGATAPACGRSCSTGQARTARAAPKGRRRRFTVS